MTKRVLWSLLFIVLFGTVSRAQDVAGDWQGTLNAPQGALRIVLKVTKADVGWVAMVYSIDQDGPDGFSATSFSVQDSIVKYSVFGGSYQGKLNADGNSIEGRWTQNGDTLQLNFVRASKETAWLTDIPPHAVQFITVDTGVKLEVLDWGGSGRPLILLAGLGNTAHVFDEFAPKLVANYHVYGITRRGFGVSSSPTPANGNYSADRLGDDVLTVSDALKLNRPVLAGHSIAGEELSSIGTRHPEKIAGLIYIEAGYPYAYYDASLGDIVLDTLDLEKKLQLLIPDASSPQHLEEWIKELLQTSLPRFEKDLQNEQRNIDPRPDKPPDKRSGVPASPEPPPKPNPHDAILESEEEYTQIKCPALAIFAVPHDIGNAFNDDPAARAAAVASDLADTGAQADAFAKGVPSARVVRLPNASHYVFRSNEADVLREMNAFMASLP
jgi:non-heme chloroperoxidase